MWSLPKWHKTDNFFLLTGVYAIHAQNPKDMSTETNSTAVPAIYSAMVEIANKLVAPKDKTNGFAKYQYRDLPSIREALKPLQKSEGVFIAKSSHTEPNSIGGEKLVMDVDFISTKDGSKVTMSHSVNCDAHKGMSNEQASGSALTYLEKYILGIAFSIDDDSDKADPDSLNGADAGNNAKETADSLIKKISNATSIEQLTALWNANPTLRTNASVEPKFTERKKALLAAA